MGKSSAPTPPKNVPYPSTKKPPHPVKAAVRVAYLRLEKAGVKLRQQRGGYPALFGMAKNAPELLETIIRTVKKSKANEKHLWRDVLSSMFFTPPSAADAEYVFGRHFHIIPIAAKKMNRHSYLRDALRETTNVFNQIRDARPDATENLTLLYEAALLNQSINPPIHYMNRVMKIVTKDNIEDIVFIAEHLDEVERIIPELKKREVRDRHMMAALLDVEATALLDGAL